MYSVCLGSEHAKPILGVLTRRLDPNLHTPRPSTNTHVDFEASGHVCAAS
jgi:hypothetical protein